MRKASQIAATIIALVLVGQPLVACITPGRTMTATEHACCVKMASMCNSSAMPMSHSCCKQSLSPQVIALGKLRGGDLAGPATFVSASLLALPQIVQLGDLHPFDSPPGSPPNLSTVLRI